MLRREVDWKNEGRVEAGPEVRVVAGVGRPDEFVPRPKTEVEPIPEMAPGRWRAQPKPTSVWVYVGYAALTLLSALLGMWFLAVLVGLLVGLWIRNARHVIGPDDPVGLTIHEIADGATPTLVGSDTGVAFLDGNALAWKGECCSFRVGGQDVRAERATFEISTRPMPDETLDVYAHGRRLRLTFQFGKWRQAEWKTIAAWAKRRPVDRAPREAPPFEAGSEISGSSIVWFIFILMGPILGMLFSTKSLFVALIMVTCFHIPLGLISLKVLDSISRSRRPLTGTAE